MKIQATDWRDTLGALASEMPMTEIDHDDHPCELQKPSRQKLRIDVERKGRGGKSATIISGFILPDEEISDIAAKLKKRLGTGGSARGGEILIQGDRRDDIKKALSDMGII